MRSPRSSSPAGLFRPGSQGQPPPHSPLMPTAVLPQSYAPQHCLACAVMCVLPGALQSPRSSSPAGLFRPGSQGQLATEQEISHMLQQQHAQLTIKRAASGIMDSVHLPPGGHKRHSGAPSTLSAAGGGGALLSSGDGGMQVGGWCLVGDTACKSTLTNHIGRIQLTTGPGVANVRRQKQSTTCLLVCWRCFCISQHTAVVHEDTPGH